MEVQCANIGTFSAWAGMVLVVRLLESALSVNSLEDFVLGECITSFCLDSIGWDVLAS